MHTAFRYSGANVIECGLRILAGIVGIALVIVGGLIIFNPLADLSAILLGGVLIIAGAILLSQIFK